MMPVNLLSISAFGSCFLLCFSESYSSRIGECLDEKYGSKKVTFLHIASFGDLGISNSGSMIMFFFSISGSQLPIIGLLIPVIVFIGPKRQIRANGQMFIKLNEFNLKAGLIFKSISYTEMLK